MSAALPLDRMTVAEKLETLEALWDDLCRHETQIPVHLADSPLTCLAVGSGRSLEEIEVIHRASRSRAARRNGLLRY